MYSETNMTTMTRDETETQMYAAEEESVMNRMSLTSELQNRETIINRLSVVTDIVELNDQEQDDDAAEPVTDNADAVANKIENQALIEELLCMEFGSC